jgi:glycerol-3-phosphate dehydrogenase subunit C
MIQTPENLARDVVDQCGNCNFCRELLADSPCMVFPKLYRLYDAEQAGRRAIAARELEALVTLCNMCGSCPCPSIRAKLRHARDGFMAREGGLPLGLRLLNNVRLLGRLGGLFPRLSNYLMQTPPWAGLLRRLLGVHPERVVPAFPRDGFDAWARPRGHFTRAAAPGRKVAYFVGCSARYLFPDVAKATIQVLERNGVAVHVPEQRCCGMPAMMEGDRDAALANVRFNMAQLLDCVDAGYDILFSCPTCCYMHKSVLRDGAHFSAQYRAYLQRELEHEGGDLRRLAERIQQGLAHGRHCGPPHSQTPMALKLVMNGVCKDEGYFADLDGMDRMRLADHCWDLGEYLRRLKAEGAFNDRLGSLPESMAYYAPCHVKEQDMGRPWLDVLAAVPGLAVPEVGDMFDCCGSSGVRGFQRKFHKLSLVQGQPLMDKMRAADPDRIATDCLSCRLQFNQALPHPVSHPAEILLAAYESAERDSAAAPPGG